MAALKSVELKIADLMLDVQNPRIPKQKSQLAALQEILNDQGKKLLELATDIVEHGLSPVDRMMVLEDSAAGNYTSLEGNRRTAALRILNTPNIVDELEISASLKQQFKQLASSFDPDSVEPIPAVIVPDRESARRWIELRHTGANEGRGIVDWTGLQSARFRGDQASKLIDLAIEKMGVSESQITTKFPISTLARLIDNPQVRAKIGISLHNGELFLTQPIKDVAKPIKRIVNDLSAKIIKVDQVKTADQQKQYIDSFSPSDLPSSPPLKSPKSVSSILGSTKAGKPTTQPVSPLSRKNIVPKQTTFTISASKPAQVFYELKRLDVDKMPLSGAILLRLFIEMTVDHVLTQSGIGIYVQNADGTFKKDGAGNTIGKKISTKIADSCSHLIAGNPQEKPGIKSAQKTLVNKASLLSIQALHDYAHNSYTIPTNTDLKITWDNSTKLFELAWQ
jgi:hypothetical protein